MLDAESVRLTQRGKFVKVSTFREESDRRPREARFIAAVHEGLAEADAGTTWSHAEVVAELDARYGKRVKGTRR